MVPFAVERGRKARVEAFVNAGAFPILDAKKMVVSGFVEIGDNGLFAKKCDGGRMRSGKLDVIAKMNLVEATRRTSGAALKDAEGRGSVRERIRGDEVALFRWGDRACAESLADQ